MAVGALHLVVGAAFSLYIDSYEIQGGARRELARFLRQSDSDTLLTLLSARTSESAVSSRRQ